MAARCKLRQPRTKYPPRSLQPGSVGAAPCLDMPVGEILPLWFADEARVVLGRRRDHLLSGKRRPHFDLGQAICWSPHVLPQMQ
jgi:hypothetical protein